MTEEIETVEGDSLQCLRQDSGPKMEIVAPHASVIVPEVLKSNNYKSWSIFMRHYLVGQDLWDVIQLSQLTARGNTRELIKKSALALHAIKISCGEEMFDKIKDMDSAKDVWDTLVDMHKPAVVSQGSAEHPLERRTGPSRNIASSQYEILIKAISNGKLGQVQTFLEDNLKDNSKARSAGIFENGYTALHFSVYKRKERIVDYLISKLSKEELEKPDNSGSTALSIAARFGVGKSIAQKLVQNDRDLLTIADIDGNIPVRLVCSTIHEDMARYLYVETPLEEFRKGDRGFYILQECINRKMFDIAFDLLRHCPELARHSCSSGSIPLILTLAQTPPPFFRGSNLPFWERWIYDCIRVKAYPIKEDEHPPCIERKSGDFYQSCKKEDHTLISVRGRVERDGVPELRYGVKRRSHVGVRTCHHHTPHRCKLVRRALAAIVVGPFVVSALMMLSIALMMLSMLLILGILILGALPMLVSMLSRYFARDLYQLKLMDEYAREVIRLICHQSLSELDQNQFVQSRAVEATFQAIKNGIPDIVKEIAKANDDILWSNTDPEDSSRNIFACAIAHRQEEVTRFLYEFAKEDANKVNTTDRDGNNILHLAARLAPPYQLGCISGSALQLQSELRWFKGVEEIVPRSYREHKNNDSKTPLEVFVGEHEDLLKKAEEWVKKTAESSTFVGALIITVTFAAAFTVPGGPDQSTGFPMLLHKTPVPFMVFMVSDAISLFAASSSVIMFLGILTSRFAYEDFLKSLPIRLAMGLSALFISIATMTMAFCAALFIMLEGRLGVVIPITLLAGIPVTFFVVLQFPLLVEIYASTVSASIFKEVPSWMRIMTETLVRLWHW